MGRAVAALLPSRHVQRQVGVQALDVLPHRLDTFERAAVVRDDRGRALVLGRAARNAQHDVPHAQIVPFVLVVGALDQLDDLHLHLRVAVQLDLKEACACGGRAVCMPCACRVRARARVTSMIVHSG